MTAEQRPNGTVRRWRGHLVRYVGGGILGAVLGLAIALGLLVTVLHYASDIAGVDINSKVASPTLVAVFLCPLVGIAVGVVVVHRRSKRRAPRRAPTTRTQDQEPGRPQRSGSRIEVERGATTRPGPSRPPVSSQARRAR